MSSALVVGGGSNGLAAARQLVFGPRTTLHPYQLGIPVMYICSAATPPGPGAHGMCGANAPPTRSITSATEADEALVPRGR